MGKARSIRFETTNSGCYVPANMKLNPDGYFRKAWFLDHVKQVEMFHRFIWRAKNGEIPEGYEINHLCKNRACQNVDHMECIDGKEHTIKTNQERYADEQSYAKDLWIRTGCRPTDLVESFGWRAYGWVRGWKQGGV